MKKILLLTAMFIVGFSFSVNAQRLSYAVSLKDGSTVEGRIIKQVPNESVTIITRAGDIIVVNTSDIEEITAEEYEDELPFATNVKDISYIVSLKNGSAIKGRVVKQVPNESITLHTSDGNIFTFRVSEIVGMTADNELGRNDFRHYVNAEDPLYFVALKSGEIIKGRIINRIPDESTTIYTPTGNVFVLEENRIDKITAEKDIKTKKESRYNVRPNGYFGFIDIAGFSTKVGEYGHDVLTLGFVNGYKFNPYFMMGIGVGLVVMTGFADFSSVYMHFRSDLTKKDIAPFISLDVGYNTIINSRSPDYNYKFRFFMLSPNVGVSFRVSRRNAITLSAGYYGLWNANKKDKNNINYPEILDERKQANSIILKVGVSF